jgi:hypothetical protein
VQVAFLRDYWILRYQVRVDVWKGLLASEAVNGDRVASWIGGLVTAQMGGGLGTCGPSAGKCNGRSLVGAFQAPAQAAQSFHARCLVRLPGEAGRTGDHRRHGSLWVQDLERDCSQWRFRQSYSEDLGLDYEDLAFANIAWCGTLDNRYPRRMLDKCLSRHTGPLLHILEPEVVLLSGQSTHRFKGCIEERLPQARVICMWHFAHRKGEAAWARECRRVKAALPAKVGARSRPNGWLLARRLSPPGQPAIKIEWQPHRPFSIPERSMA